MKQFPKSKAAGGLDDSARIEIEVANVLFPMELRDNRSGDEDDDYRRIYGVDPAKMPGIRSIAMLVDVVEDNKDLWLIYEVGAKCLAKQLTEVKGEFYKGERIYRVAHQIFY